MFPNLTNHDTKDRKKTLLRNGQGRKTSDIFIIDYSFRGDILRHMNLYDYKFLVQYQALMKHNKDTGYHFSKDYTSERKNLQMLRKSFYAQVEMLTGRDLNSQYIESEIRINATLLSLFILWEHITPEAEKDFTALFNSMREVITSARTLFRIKISHIVSSTTSLYLHI